MNKDVLFSSENLKWETPKTLISDLSEVFNWDLDVCASNSNVCDNFLSENSLEEEWDGLCWMNPPYGRKIGDWINKAKESNTTVVCLIPSRTDTKWWHDNFPYCTLVVFIKGRLKFEGAKQNAPFPSAFMVFGKLSREHVSKLKSYGILVYPNREEK